MYCSIYNDKKFETKKLFFKNLIKSYHFSSSVRTPPNKYHINFIGELNIRQKPHFDTLFTSQMKNSHNSNFTTKKNNNFSYKKRKKIKASLLPKLLINNNINNINSNKNKCVFTNRILNNEDIGIIDLNFPYCKPKLKTSKSNIIIKNKYNIKNKYLNLKNNDKTGNKKSNRLFFKSLSNFHQIINKIKKEDS